MIEIEGDRGGGFEVKLGKFIEKKHFIFISTKW